MLARRAFRIVRISPKTPQPFPFREAAGKTAIYSGAEITLKAD